MVINNKNQDVKRFNTNELREKRERAVTMKFNGKTYDEFKIIMKEQDLNPSLVLNQFMKLTNDILKKENGGEVCFIFEPTKKEGDDNKK